MRICAVGDNVVDRYIDRGVMYPGGNAVNVAVHVRRCGTDSAYIGAVGDDEAGVLVADALAAEGVDVTRLRVVPGPNAYAEVRVVDGDRVFTGSDNGVSRFALDAGDLDYLSTFDLVHTGDCSFLEQQVREIAAVAPVSFDFSNRADVYAESLLPYVTLATFSRSEYDERDVLRLAAWAHGFGVRYVVVTRGSAGASISDGSRVVTRPPVEVDVVDTLGAGDAFIARACVGVVTGEPIDEISVNATAYAALTCQSYGAFGYEAADPAARDRSAPSYVLEANPII